MLVDLGHLLLADSVTEAIGVAAGRILVTGSHGGESAARFAIDGRPALVVFNDAGVGKDGAGVTGLALLERAGIAACTVAHTSACIGQARSTLNDGIVSHANAAAALLGLLPGTAVSAALRSDSRD